MHEENNNQETELNRIKEIQKENRLNKINKFQSGGTFEQNNANARSYYSRWLSNRLPILKKNGGFKSDKETQKEYVTQVGDMYDTKVFSDKDKAEQYVQAPFRTMLDNNNKESVGVDKKADSLLNHVKDWTKQTIRDHDALTDKSLDLRFGENVKGYPRYSLLSGKGDVNIGLTVASRFSFGDERDYRGAYGKAIVKPIDSTKSPIKKSAIFLNPKKAVGSTPLHELTHAAQNPRERKIPQVEAIGSMIPVRDEYYDNPLEVHSRLMQFRMENKLDPKKKYTPDEIKSLRKSAKDFNLFERYSDDQMSDLINNIAATADKNRSIAFAQLGTKLKGLNSDDLLDVKETTGIQLLRNELRKPLDMRKYTNQYADGTRTKLDHNPTSEQAASISKRSPVERAAANQTRIIDNKREVLKRKENIAATKTDGSIGGNTALGDKLRIFKDTPNSFVDEYLNVPSMIGYAADNFNNVVVNRNTPQTTLGDKALATGLFAASLYGPMKAKGALNKVNQVVNPFADMLPGRGRKIRPSGEGVVNAEGKIVHKLEQPKFDSGDFDIDDMDPEDIVNSFFNPTKLKEIKVKELHRNVKQIVPSFTKDQAAKHYDYFTNKNIHDTKQMKMILARDVYPDQLSFPGGYTTDPLDIPNSTNLKNTGTIKPLTDNKHKLAQDFYTLGYDTHINKRSPYIKSDEYENALDNVRKDLEEAVKQNKLANDTQLFRGVSDHRANIIRNGQPVESTMSKLEIGDEFEPGSFLSTSLNKRNNFYTHNKIKMQINAPGGNKQSILHPNSTPEVSNVPMEEEIILPSKLRYKLKDKQHDPETDVTKLVWDILNPYMVPAVGVGLGVSNLKEKK